MKFLLSSGIDTILKYPNKNFQYSLLELNRDIINDYTQIPQNIKVIHAPIKLDLYDNSMWDFICGIWNKEHPIIFHPNKMIINYCKRLSISNRPTWHFENFPKSTKKPYCTPLEIKNYCNENGFSICYDYGHISENKEEIQFKEYDFLSEYLKEVSIIHFSGCNHNALTNKEWITWKQLVKNNIDILNKISYIIFEHIKFEDKLKDARILWEMIKGVS